jgi:hypothetical protein
MAGTVCVAVGLSLTDRNMRRLLDAVRAFPERHPCFALLQRPQPAGPTPGEMERIRTTAAAHHVRFGRPGTAPPNPSPQEIEALVAGVAETDLKQQASVLEELRVEPIWYDDHGEVPGILQRLMP